MNGGRFTRESWLVLAVVVLAWPAYAWGWKTYVEMPYLELSFAGWHEYVAASLRQQGKHASAIEVYERLVTLDPDNARAHHALAQELVLAERNAEAIAAYESLLRIAADDAEVHAALAEQWLKLGSQAKAVAQFRDALRLDSQLALGNSNLQWANNLAWLLATSREAGLRNGAEAVRWARQVEITAGRDRPEFLDTLAAALAEDGQFSQAIDAQRRFIAWGQSSRPSAPDDATRRHIDHLLEQAQARLKLYEASQPYHEP
jgi:tetratricopeptide (TPR) repeat protein